MQHILIKFGLCHVVVIDDGTLFKGAFIAMCQVLNLNYDMLAKRNHKGITATHFYRFLNKSVAITAEERGTNDIFVPASIVAEHTWNGAPIDITDILRSIPAIGQELHSSIDINLNTLPKLTQNNAQVALKYLKLTDSSRYFSKLIFKCFIEERQIAHTEYINNSRNLAVLNPDDIVIARTVIQSNKSQNKVAKLRYTVRDPYYIILNTGHGSYYVKKINQPDNSVLKFMVYDLYSLPLSLKSCEPVDAIDTRYLNQTDAQLINPLKISINIEFHNEKWFNKTLPTSTPLFTYKQATLQFTNEPLTPFPSLVELYKDTKTSLPRPLLENTDHFFQLLIPLLSYINFLSITLTYFSSNILLKILSNLVDSLFK